MNNLAEVIAPPSLPRPGLLDPTVLSPGTSEVLEYLNRNVIGQSKAAEAVVKLLQNIKAGLNEPGRPAGSFLFLGPTGTGKTRMVESVAEAFHADPKTMLVVNCGEYQMEHEGARLIGAPPGYLGHRETPPVITQQKITAMQTAKVPITIILFDEIEKAANSLMRILLGILDKGTLRCGDGTIVDFSKCLIFLTSNLGAKELRRQHFNDMGFNDVPQVTAGAAKSSGERAAKKSFSPEFWNRLDRVVTFAHLGDPELREILDLEVNKLESRAEGKFLLTLSLEAKKFLLTEGTSMEYGARELKRIMFRYLIEPLSNLVVSDQIPRGHEVYVNKCPSSGALEFSLSQAVPPPSTIAVVSSAPANAAIHLVTNPKTTRRIKMSPVVGGPGGSLFGTK